jgi:hypothetical protein
MTPSFIRESTKVRKGLLCEYHKEGAKVLMEANYFD